ncbi:Maltose permease MAL31 [Vanrija pseudolonga]|uniref:Maltose permease MAL31 n=1 Tax=Vanrija pseudolonga TaxID=143232 RepID=A0AAF0YK36_9TREE|nr:Maltose permease MAL31 [Vanrija pseudolonga]
MSPKQQPDKTGASTPTNSDIMAEDKAVVEYSEVMNEGDGKMTAEQARVEDLLRAAEAATRTEHKMTLMQGLRQYPKACFWSMMISVAVIMEAFDLTLLGNFYAYPSFRKKFGNEYINKDGEVDWQVPASWMAGIGNAAGVTSILGVLLNGIIAERFGYRRTTFWALIWLTCVIFIFFFAQNKEMLLAAQFCAGFVWGIFQTLTTTYAAEVAPLPLRGILTTWVNACWGIGQLLGIAMLRGLLHRKDDWGWRIPFALQWFWPPILIVVAIFAPESPWWLVRKGRVEEARASLHRLYSGDATDEVNNALAMIEHTIAMEENTTKGASYLELFKGTNLRRTEIVCGCWAVQQMCGSAFMGSSTYFLEQAGWSVENAFSMTMGSHAINTGGTFIAWILIGMGIGRRALYFWGCAWMCMVLLIIGGISLIGNKASSLAIGIILLTWQVAYQFTVGTVCYSLVAEIPSRRLAIKSINLGRGCYNIIGVITNSYHPYMLNPTAWNWGGKTAFYWGGTCMLCMIWIYFRLPEPKGLTFYELNARFEAKIPARKFQTTEIDVWAKDEKNMGAAVAALDKQDNDDAAGVGRKTMV